MPLPLAYRVYGHTGPSVLILHGLFGQADNWTRIAKTMSEQGFTVYTIDLRNHGLSPHSETWTYEDMADDVRFFIEQHSLTKPLCIGHSMGGKVLLYMEHMFTGIVSAYIIVDIAAKYYAPHHQTIFKALNAIDLTTVTTRKAAEATLELFIKEPEIRQFLLKNLFWKSTSPAALAWRFNLDGLYTQADAIGKAVPAYHSKTPCALIYGSLSNYIEISDIEDYKMRFNTLQLYKIEGAAHWVHAEQPQAFINAFTDFVNFL